MPERRAEWQAVCVWCTGVRWGYVHSVSTAAAVVVYLGLPPAGWVLTAGTAGRQKAGKLPKPILKSRTSKF